MDLDRSVTTCWVPDRAAEASEDADIAVAQRVEHQANQFENCRHLSLPDEDDGLH